MTFSKRYLYVSVFALLCVSILGPWTAVRAQEAKKSRSPIDSLPPGPLRDHLNQLQELRQEPEREIVDKKAIPWCNERGERLVAVVQDRTLTKTQMDRRVNLMLSSLPRLSDPQKEEDRLVLMESQVVSDWADMTALSLLATSMDIKVTDEEVDRELQSLATSNEPAGQGKQQQMRMIGIPESDLRTEIRDGILVEKLVKQATPLLFSEEQMKKLYEADRDTFLIPPRVHAVQINRPLRRPMTRKAIDKAYDDLSKLRKKFKKCKTKEDALALKKEIESPDAVLVSDLGWVVPTDPFPAAVLREIFALEPGETSQVFPPKNALRGADNLYLIKVLERESGSTPTFEAARPQIENYLFEKTKGILIDAAPYYYDIYTAASGLNKWVVVRPAPTPGPQDAKSEKSKPTEKAEPDDQGLFGKPPTVEEVLKSKHKL